MNDAAVFISQKSSNSGNILKLSPTTVYCCLNGTGDEDVSEPKTLRPSSGHSLIQGI